MQLLLYATRAGLTSCAGWKSITPLSSFETGEGRWSSKVIVLVTNEDHHCTSCCVRIENLTMVESSKRRTPSCVCVCVWGGVLKRVYVTQVHGSSSAYCTYLCIIDSNRMLMLFYWTVHRLCVCVCVRLTETLGDVGHP